MAFDGEPRVQDTVLLSLPCLWFLLIEVTEMLNVPIPLTGCYKLLVACGSSSDYWSFWS